VALADTCSGIIIPQAHVSCSQTELELIYYGCSGAVEWIIDRAQGSMSGETHQSSPQACILNSQRLAVRPKMSPAQQMWRFWNLQHLLSQVPNRVKYGRKEGWTPDLATIHTVPSYYAPCIGWSAIPKNRGSSPYVS
jgi:hypothetical protein